MKAPRGLLIIVMLGGMALMILGATGVLTLKVVAAAGNAPLYLLGYGAGCMLFAYALAKLS